MYETPTLVEAGTFHDRTRYHKYGHRYDYRRYHRRRRHYHDHYHW